jgi:hypothetical protein
VLWSVSQELQELQGLQVPVVVQQVSGQVQVLLSSFPLSRRQTVLQPAVEILAYSLSLPSFRQPCFTLLQF